MDDFSSPEFAEPELVHSHVLPAGGTLHIEQHSKTSACSVSCVSEATLTSAVVGDVGDALRSPVNPNGAPPHSASTSIATASEPPSSSSEAGDTVLAAPIEDWNQQCCVQLPATSAASCAAPEAMGSSPESIKQVNFLGDTVTPISVGSGNLAATVIATRDGSSRDDAATLLLQAAQGPAVLAAPTSGLPMLVPPCVSHLIRPEQATNAIPSFSVAGSADPLVSISIAAAVSTGPVALSSVPSLPILPGSNPLDAASVVAGVATRMHPMGSNEAGQHESEQNQPPLLVKEQGKLVVCKGQTQQYCKDDEQEGNRRVMAREGQQFYSTVSWTVPDNDRHHGGSVHSAVPAASAAEDDNGVAALLLGFHGGTRAPPDRPSLGTTADAASFFRFGAAASQEAMHGDGQNDEDKDSEAHSPLEAALVSSRDDVAALLLHQDGLAKCRQEGSQDNDGLRIDNHRIPRFGRIRSRDGITHARASPVQCASDARLTSSSGGDDNNYVSDVVDLCGLTIREAVGARLQVSYMERQGKALVPVAYRGSVASVDMRKGLRVKLDGYVRREWVTDEDEWVWLPEHDMGTLRHQAELMRSVPESGASDKGHGRASGLSATGTADQAAVSARAAPAFLAASLVRLLLRGMPHIELPPSLTQKPRRSSAVRPLPHTHVGAAHALAHEEREKLAQTRPPKPDPKVPPSPLPTADMASTSSGDTIAADGRGVRGSLAADVQAPLIARSGSSSVDGETKESGGDNATVTIANGPNSGTEAKVLHVGNGWVKLLLPSGSVVHMRKWDLLGEIPLKLRSPSKVNRTAGYKASEHTLMPPPPHGPDSSSQQQYHHKQDVSEQASPQAKQAHVSVTRSSRASVNTTDSAVSTAGPVSSQSSAAGSSKAHGHAAAPVLDAQRKARKRPPEVLQDGLALGAQVWARWSGIKFSHGVISKLLTSSKWVLVTFDNDTSQWVTSRELVLDEQPTASVLEEGTEVIAAWEDDDDFYKGTIVGVQSSGRYRVRYDDWDDAIVMLEGLRVLPDGFGKKKRAGSSKLQSIDGLLDKSSAVSSHQTASGVNATTCSHLLTSGAGVDRGGRGVRCTASATRGASECIHGSIRNANHGDEGVLCSRATILVPSRNASGSDRMANFVRDAREQLLATDSVRFEALTRLLARGGCERWPHSPIVDKLDDPDKTFEAELVSLLSDYPVLLRELRSLLSSTLTTSPSIASNAAPDVALHSTQDATAYATHVPKADSQTLFAPTIAIGDLNSIDVWCGDANAPDALHTQVGAYCSRNGGPSAAPASAVQGKGKPGSTEGSRDVRGAYGKGVRELHKLLHDFGDGSMVGVEIGSKTRQRGPSNADGSGAALDASGSPAFVPLPKRTREI